MTDTLDIAERLRQKRGRDARGQSLATRFTREEERVLAAAAEANNMTLREWSREVLLREARRLNGDPIFTELIATRTMLNKVLRQITRGQGMTPEQFNAMQDEIRATKHATAREVMQQYIPLIEKEK